FAFNFSHDFSHDTVFANKKWNHWGYTLIYTLMGAHAESWKYRHVHSHHFAPNVEGFDSDLSITGLIRVVPGSELRWFHRFQHLYAPVAYMTYSLYWILIKDPVMLFRKEEKVQKDWAYHLSFWLQKLVYLTVILAIPLLFAKHSVFHVLGAFLLMHALQSLFLLFTFFMTHHVEGTHYPTTDSDGSIKESWVMNQVKSSNDMHPFSWWANFLLGGFNNHIAHHLFPHIHHLFYPRLSVLLYQQLQAYGWTPNQTSYWGGVVSHLKFLKRMGSEA
ncbi:MAG: fatty acid desaturase, partial [Bacteroidota bacterium]|nr:fatty acid desaturase [Bacteroidota bacterium]MDX5430001.1 fatty acid desaturase [Bacteroidota bacterium]MDX5468774.1 fatty acid desaturase [Bacteroidota bacterium]